MDKREFKELLMLYGADISRWPDGLNDEARALLKAGSESSEELTALVEEEASFEALLAKRSFEEPSDYLAGRIIAFAEESAAKENAPVQERGLLGWIFAEFFTPRAAIALTLTLVIGFMVGYMTPKLSDPFDQLALEDEMMLEETFSSLFMEGDIFE
jgi:hypothetical protein